jgi:hypothetical protein
MEWGLVLHLMFGGLMITKETIFDYKSSMGHNFIQYGDAVGKFASNFLHIEPTRFSKTHGAMYVLASGILITCFIFDKMSSWFLDSEAGLFSYSVVCCCSRLCRVKKIARHNNSNDLLNEIPIGDLQKEYNDCKQSRDDKLV